jgi:hypothetical protein
MTRIPDLWWSPGEGLFHRRPGDHHPTRVLTAAEFPAHERGTWDRVPEDAVRLRQDMGSDYIRVGETIATQDRQDVYILASGPQTMYLEPVDTGAPHVIAFAENGWTMKHPLGCRAQLFQCPVHKAALKSEPFDRRQGRFACTANYDGFLVIGEETS